MRHREAQFSQGRAEPMQQCCQTGGEVKGALILRGVAQKGMFDITHFSEDRSRGFGKLSCRGRWQDLPACVDKEFRP
jgi:hypothetical protein